MKKILILAAFVFAANQLKSEDRTSEIFLSLTKKINSSDYFYSNNAQTAILTGDELKISNSLNDSPSFVLRENTSNLGLSLGSVRGFGSNQTVVVYDGIKLPKDITSTYDLSILPITGIEKVYLLNGGWSGVFGSNAEGGVIGLKTESVKKDSQLVELKSDYGSYSSKRHILKTAISKDNISVLTALENYNSEGFQENSKATRNSFVSKMEYDFSNFGKTTLNMFAVDLKRGIPSGTPVDIKSFNGERERKANSLTDWQNDKNLFLSLNHKFDLGEFSNRISYSRNNLIREAYQWGSLTEIKTYSNNALLESSFKKLNFGLEMEETYLRSNDYGNHNIKNYGYFANYDARFSEKFSSKMYLRYDDNKNYNNMFSPKLVTSYAITDKYSLSYSLGRSWRAPNFADIYGSSAYWYDPNPDIKPEKSVSNEIGLSYSGAVNYNITAYYYDIDDKISVYFDPNTWRSKSVNMAKGYNRGAEFNLGYGYDWLKLNVGANLIDVKGKNKGESSYKVLAYSPKYKLNFSLGYEKNNFTSVFKAIKVGTQYSGADKTGKKIPTYEVCSLDIYKKFENLVFKFSIDNIFNERYATTADVFNGYYPSNPRNYTASLSLKF
ncbi:MAG: TonB-dependent receptor plug domain-containing protein [Elusimicrobiales bacterium]|nr:TonB-dependent receptor [Elusimicrobiales bacterium]HOL62601.1 TonB-dependent receptor [Elusimicrobiales bacterium]HPO95756.1 TonB-dependent receptor [Elusimicrobiales bacterium]